MQKLLHYLKSFVLLFAICGFIQCSDNASEPQPDNFDLEGRWEGRDTTTYVCLECSVEYNHYILTFEGNGFRYIMKTKVLSDGEVVRHKIKEINGNYTIDYPEIKFTPELEDSYTGEISGDSFFLFYTKGELIMKEKYALLFPASYSDCSRTDLCGRIYRI